MREHARSIRGFVRLLALTLAPGVAAAVAPAPALAQEGAAAAQETVEESVKPWSNEAQVALVDAAGNSSSTTFAISERFTYNWTFSELVLGAELFRSTTETRVLTNDAGTARESLVDTVAAERYEVTGKYRQNLLGDLFWVATGAWYRNRPAGIDSRVGFTGGVGYRFLENASSLVAGEIGVGVARETPVALPADTFADGRAYLEIRHAFSDSGSLQIEAELLDNLQDTDDLRINGRVSLTSKLTDVFALRVGWDLRYDKQPAFVIVDGGPGVPAASFVLDDLDRTLSASLVVSF